MGHRREIFKPRKRSTNIKKTFERNLKEKEYQKATQIAITHYTNTSTGTDFSTAIIATSEGKILRGCHILESRQRY